MSRLRDSDKSVASVITTEASGVTVPSFMLDMDLFKTRMEKFQNRFDQTVQLTNDSVKSVVEEFSNILEDNKETEKLMKSEISKKRSKEEELSKKLDDIKDELDRTRSSLQERENKRQQLLASQSKYQQQIDALQEQIDKKRRQKQSYRENVMAQAGLNDTEVLYWEDVLGLRIEGMAENYLKFIFTNLDNISGAANEANECSLVLDMTSEEFKVRETRPELESSKLAKALADLNRTQQLGLFFKDIRRLFKDARRVS